MKETLIKKVLHDTLPVVAGYLVLGMGFGIIMNTQGYSFLETLSMSVFIYAGSMQYAAISLFESGASLVTVALTILAVNARHLFYGISMIDKYKDAGKRKPYMIFALTDETYSLVVGSDDKDYCFLVSLFDHIYWISGSAIGYLLKEVITFNNEGIDFALTALFITVFTDQWLKTKDHFASILGVVASAVCLLVFGRGSFLIPTMAVLTVILLWKGKGEKDV